VRPGLTVGEVTEIRCSAENEKISPEAHLDAEEIREWGFSRPSVKK